MYQVDVYLRVRRAVMVDGMSIREVSRVFGLHRVPVRKKKFRVRYDKIVDFEPFSDDFGLMRDAQTAKPQSFRTGDGWFAYNLAVNLAQM